MHAQREIGDIWFIHIDFSPLTLTLFFQELLELMF